MKSLLPCCLFKSGTKFIVTSDVKETTFPPGTTAFMSHMREPDVDYQNVARIKAITIRRGKGGMDRIDINSMSIPIFNDKRMLGHENYLPIGKRYYVHIEEVATSEIDIMKMQNMDFLGWACAKAISLRHLTNNMAKSTAPKLWPKNNNGHPLLIASRLADFFDSDKDTATTKFAEDMDFRRNFVKEIRFLEAAAVKCDVLYQKLVASAILNSARFVSYTNKNYFKVVNEEQAVNTINLYKKMLKWLNKMVVNVTKEG